MKNTIELMICSVSVKFIYSIDYIEILRHKHRFMQR